MLSSIIIANILISLLSLSGGLFLLRKNLISKKIIPYMVAFAAGVILTTVFFDLLPEALEQAKETGSDIFMPIFLGIIISFFIERFQLWFHHHGITHGIKTWIKPSLSLVLLGDAIHNFIDGIVIAAAFLTSPTLGIVTSFAIAAHEIPQEIADFTILIHSGLKKNTALFLNLLSALTAIVGGITGFYFIQNLKNGLPFLLSFSSGIFIYISGSDLIPHLHIDFKKQRKWVQVVPFLLGIVLMYLLINQLRFSH